MSAETQASCSRRWRVAVSCSTVIAFIVLGAIYQRSLRLNPAERLILGEWSFADTGNPSITRHVRFGSDRTFHLWTSTNASGTGTWKISDDELVLKLKADDDSNGPTRLLFLDRYINRFWTRERPERFLVDELTRNTARVRNAANDAIIFQRVSLTE